MVAIDNFKDTYRQFQSKNTLSQELKNKIELEITQQIAEAERLVVNKAVNIIPNLVNKIDNIIDDIANAALKEIEVTDEIVKASNTLSDAAKKFWANHEVN